MGEIERIHPIVKPVVAPTPTQGVDPAGKGPGRHAHDDRDRIELANRNEEDDSAEESELPNESGPSEYGIDLAI